MKKRRENKKIKALRQLLNTPVSMALFDKIPWETLSRASFAGLAAFGLWPVLILIPTIQQCAIGYSFDYMVYWTMTLLDKFIFPFVALASLAVYALALAKALREKRPLSGTLRRNPAFALFLALVVWMTVNIPLTNGLVYSVMHGAGLKHESFPLVLEYFLCFLPIGLFLRNERLKLWLLRGMTAVSAVLASCAFYLHDHLTASPYYYDWAPSYSALFTTWNYYGYFLCVFVGLSAALFTVEESRCWHWGYALSLALNTAVLSCNNSLGSWIGAFCACLFIVAARRVMDGKFHPRSLQALALFTLVLCLTGVVNGRLKENAVGLSGDVQAVIGDPDSGRANSAGSGRWHIWKESLKLIAQHPIVGIGYEGVHVRVLEFVGNPRPHNEYIQYALFYGIPGGLLYPAACAAVYIRAFRRRARLDNLTFAALAAAFAYLTGSFFGLTVYNTAPYLFIMLGLGYVWEDGAEKAERRKRKKNAAGTVALSDGA